VQVRGCDGKQLKSELVPPVGYELISAVAVAVKLKLELAKLLLATSTSTHTHNSTSFLYITSTTNARQSMYQEKKFRKKCAR
jgi:hypothetical protein